MNQSIKARFVITEEQHEELKAGSKLTGKTRSFLLRQCLVQCLKPKIKQYMVATEKQGGSHLIDSDYSELNNKNNGADSMKLLVKNKGVILSE